MITIREAIDLIEHNVKPLAPRSVSLINADGCRLSENVVSSIDVPDFNASIMDGIAVRLEDFSGDGPWRLPVTGVIPAGETFVGALQIGTAVKIMTGAPVPECADAIIKVEEIRFENESVIIQRKPAPGQFLRPRGDDIRSSESVIQKGNVLTPIEIGIAASIGRTELQVLPRPGVAILPTGSEVIPPDQPLKSGQKHDSMSSTLPLLLKRDGFFDTTVFKAVADDLDAMVKVIEAAFTEHQVIITIGSVSAGDYDLIPQAARLAGGSVVYHKVKVKPGKPAILVKFNDKWLIGLPGNPVSVVVGYHLWVKRVLGIMTGIPVKYRTITARLVDNLPLGGDRRLVIGVALEETDDGYSAHPAHNQDSGRLSSILGVDGFIYADPATKVLPAGTEVIVELL